MQHRKTENTFALLGGAVLGAAAMYLLDPEAGRRRRQSIAESAEEALRATGETVGPAFGAVASRAGDIGSRLSERAQDIGARLAERASKAGGSARDAGSGAYESSRDALSGWGESLGDWGRRLTRRTGEYGSSAASGISDRARRLNPWHEEEESHATAYTVAGVSAAALGAGLIYLLDPTNGRSRRAAAANSVTRIVNDTGRAFRSGGKYVQDLMNRGRGTVHETRSRLSARSSGPTTPEQLLQRVRSEMGHVVSHAGSIQVMADGNGTVTLGGRILASEVDALLSTVNKIPGVVQVINRLDVQDTVEAVTDEPSVRPM